MQEGFSNRTVLCDASSLISLTESCLLGVLERIAESFEGEFAISQKVKAECIDRPIKMKSHALTAVRLKAALKRGTLKLVKQGAEKGTKEIMWIANNIYYIKDRPLSIVHLGEAEMIAIARKLGTKNILIDERTTRMIVEDPDKLKSHMEREFKRRVEINREYLDRFLGIAGDFRIVRSSELVMIAREKGYFKDYANMERKAVESALYGLKFNGCGISFSEIDEFCNGVW